MRFAVKFAAVLAAVLMVACVHSAAIESKSDESAAPVSAEEELAIIEQPEPAAHLYTDDDAVALAQMAWGECRGVGAFDAGGVSISGTCQKAATMWVALNRYDAGYEDSIVEVVAAPHQFVGYSAEHPIDPELLSLAYDVLLRWETEKLCGVDCGRVLPADYFWFLGDGKHNYFYNEYGSQQHYMWELADVYGD